MATRQDMHWGRRLFHIAGGLSVALAYGFFFTHSEAVHLLGATACIVYVFDKIRIAYPTIAQRVQGIANFFLRAEERLAESSMIPYVIAVLLTIISFPKPIALIAILTLTLADPLSAIIGIRYGKRHVVKNKTIEGSMAFWSVTFLCSFFVLFRVVSLDWKTALGVSFLTSVAVAVFEMLPIKLDDNLTIPLFTGFVAWAICGIVGVVI